MGSEHTKSNEKHPIVSWTSTTATTENHSWNIRICRIASSHNVYLEKGFPTLGFKTWSIYLRKATPQSKSHQDMDEMNFRWIQHNLPARVEAAWRDDGITAETWQLCDRIRYTCKVDYLNTISSLTSIGALVWVGMSMVLWVANVLEIMLTVRTPSTMGALTINEGAIKSSDSPIIGVLRD